MSRHFGRGKGALKHVWAVATDFHASLYFVLSSSPEFHATCYREQYCVICARKPPTPTLILSPVLDCAAAANCSTGIASWTTILTHGWPETPRPMIRSDIQGAGILTLPGEVFRPKRGMLCADVAPHCTAKLSSTSYRQV